MPEPHRKYFQIPVTLLRNNKNLMAHPIKNISSILLRYCTTKPFYASTNVSHALWSGPIENILRSLLRYYATKRFYASVTVSQALWNGHIENIFRLLLRY